MWHFFLKNVEKSNKVMHLRLVLTCRFYNIFNTKKHLAWALKKFPFIFLCIPNKVKESSQRFLYTTIMDQKCTNDIRFSHNKNLDQNLAWLTQKTEEPKSNKGNLTFPSHIVNMTEL